MTGIRLTLTEAQINALRAVVHGAQDDDDGSDKDYSRNLAQANQRLLDALRRRP